ncbi:hypothetical protein AB0C84_44435 [Actinomadura sp. NPDC048955]|uniref:hypothetical protein n=1 Tax=Actinomadura sp. NPDC048955 TaxID=3158228 RepID=UPI0033E75266
MDDQTARPGASQPAIQTSSDPDGAGVEHPDRYERLLRVLIRERIHAQIEARYAQWNMDPEEEQRLLAQAAAIRTVARLVLVGEIRLVRPHYLQPTVHGSAIGAIRDLTNELTREMNCINVQPYYPTTTRPDGNAPAAERLIQRTAASFASLEAFTTRHDIRERQRSMVEGRAHRLYRVLFHLAVDQLQCDALTEPGPTRHAPMLPNATQLRTRWVKAARAAVIEKAKAERRRRTEDNDRARRPGARAPETARRHGRADRPVGDGAAQPHRARPDDPADPRNGGGR